MTFFSYVAIGLLAFACSLVGGWVVAQCMSDMDNDGTDRRESEREDIYGGRQ